METTTHGVEDAAAAAPATVARSERRADIDWLRVIAFGLLIYFHAAVVFLPQGIPMVINAESSPVLQVFVAFLQEFRLGLLFLVSGMGVRFALRKRSRNQFFCERASRLLVPLLFGILVIVPPMVYLEKLFVGADPGSFPAFYSALFDGVYPHGNLSWHHYWFVAYLFLYCILSWRIFPYLMGNNPAVGAAKWAAWLAQGLRIFLFPLVLLCAEIPLRIFFPGFRDLIHDWASFAHWWLLFLAGFGLVCQPLLLDRCQNLRRFALGGGVLCSALLFTYFFDFAGASFSPLYDGQVSVAEYLAFCVLRMVNAWSWLVACVGFAGRYLRRSNVVLRYLTQAVYPLFCLHLTISVGLSYLVVPLAWPVALKYLVITSGTIGVALLSYEVLIKRIGWLQPMFGLRS